MFALLSPCFALGMVEGAGAASGFLVDEADPIEADAVPAGTADPGGS